MTVTVGRRNLKDELGSFASTIALQKYAQDLGGGRKESWPQVAKRQGDAVVRPFLDDAVADRVTRLIAQRKLMPGGRFLYAAGRKYPQCQNCFLLFVEDTREAWANLCSRVCNCLMTGGGIGVVYSKVRPEGEHISGLGGQATGPVALMQAVNEIGRQVRQGGSRRSAIWAGLHWDHPDVKKFVRSKDWPEWLAAKKRENFDTPAPLDMTNVSVVLDDAFFAAYHDPTDPKHDLACEVYWDAVRHACRTGEPGFSVDCGTHSGEHARNACTEVTSADDNDVCTLASINLARVESLDELEEVVDYGTAFLTCGTLYSTVPYEAVRQTRDKNRRLGLGLMGLHEWLLVRGKKYGPDRELRRWLEAYASAGDFAKKWSQKLSVNCPVATRAVAPTGTISIVGETTSGIEPVFSPALKRRWLKGKQWHAAYIVDATARRLIEEAGVRPQDIETAYDLAADPRRRVDFQCWVQQFVDMAISSTINLPSWGSPLNNESTVTRFGTMLVKRLPRLRGITVYPDGARGGQPLVPVPYDEAKPLIGQEIVEGGESRSAEVSEYGNEVACPGGVCGI